MTIRPGIPARPRRRTQQERRDTTREALLDATIDCLAQSGFASLTLARVSERAGLTVGAHLHHFKTRTALVAAAMERLAERRLGEVRNLDAEHLAPGDLL
ncbi:MAG TPA: helix-turn-helix domain-containing protein, partial [Streptosporangiaceae bacterium]|nr:helix-turn-helix domain-containing protein [Streptosporangiaceae bacterium]